MNHDALCYVSNDQSLYRLGPCGEYDENWMEMRGRRRLLVKMMVDGM